MGNNPDNAKSKGEFKTLPIAFYFITVISCFTVTFRILCYGFKLLYVPKICIMDKLLSYLAARIELKVCDERRACEKHICNKQPKKAPEKTRIAMRSNGPQKQVAKRIAPWTTMRTDS